MKEFELERAVDVEQVLGSNPRSVGSVKPQAIVVPVAAVPVVVIAAAVVGAATYYTVATSYHYMVSNQVKFY